jgi:hypothetical protein
VSDKRSLPPRCAEAREETTARRLPPSCAFSLASLAFSGEKPQSRGHPGPGHGACTAGTCAPPSLLALFARAADSDLRARALVKMNQRTTKPPSPPRSLQDCSLSCASLAVMLANARAPAVQPLLSRSCQQMLGPPQSLHSCLVVMLADARAPHFWKGRAGAPAVVRRLVLADPCPGAAVLALKVHSCLWRICWQMCI